MDDGDLGKIFCICVRISICTKTFFTHTTIYIIFSIKLNFCGLISTIYINIDINNHSLYISMIAF